MTKCKLGIIYGGKSSEHKVSLETAFSVLQAIDYQNYTVTPFYIHLDGSWSEGNVFCSAPQSTNELHFPAHDEKLDLFLLKKKIDVIFPVIHGPFGEDGTLQGLLEMLDIPYVGCGVLASSAGMDKVLMKNVFKSEGLPQCQFLHFSRHEITTQTEAILNMIESELDYPCFVKPANLGSSVGISKANNREEAKKSLFIASSFDRRVIIEEFVHGREIEIGVLGNEDVKTSAIGEILSINDFYDFTAKYQNTGTKLQIPANLPPSVKEEMSLLAKKAFKALDGSGLSRIDFFYNESDDQLYINEINTMPGFTSFSMYPLLFQEAGISYPHLITELIQLAIDRYEDKKKNRIDAGDVHSGTKDAASK